jgi:hypothetical protein
LNGEARDTGKEARGVKLLPGRLPISVHAVQRLGLRLPERVPRPATKRLSADGLHHVGAEEVVDCECDDLAGRVPQRRVVRATAGAIRVPRGDAPVDMHAADGVPVVDNDARPGGVGAEQLGGRGHRADAWMVTEKDGEEQDGEGEHSSSRRQRENRVKPSQYRVQAGVYVLFLLVHKVPGGNSGPESG